jgi:glycosyltransferase involved in cell wall biosynthesis
MVRVLHVLDQLALSSGVSNVVMGYIRNIDPSKFIIDVAIYLPSDENLIKEVEAKKGKVYQLPNISFPFASEYRRGFAELLKGTEYPLIHGHLPTAAFLFLKEAKRKGVPHRIIHAHSCGTEGSLKRLRNRALMMLIPLYANHYAACSDAAAAYVYGNARGSLVLPNATEPERFKFDMDKRREMRKALNIKDGELCIGHVGRFTAIKNHSFLLNAFNELLQARPDAKLVLVGDGELRGAIERQIRELNLEQAVRLTGECDNPDAYCQAFDQFWFPSIKEGLGVAGLEAQCAGLPCLFSENIPREIRVIERNVKFLAIDSPKKWAEAALQTGEIERLDTTGEFYRRGLDISTQIKKLENSYETMLRE